MASKKVTERPLKQQRGRKPSSVAAKDVVEEMDVVIDVFEKIPTKKGAGRPKKAERGRKPAQRCEPGTSGGSGGRLWSDVVRGVPEVPAKKRRGEDEEDLLSGGARACGPPLLASQETPSPDDAAGDVESYEQVFIKATEIWDSNMILLPSQDSSTLTSSAAADDIIKFQEARADVVVGCGSGAHHAAAAAAPGTAPATAPATAPSARSQDEYTDGFMCVASGTKNQAHFKDGANSQCVVISSSGFAYAMLKRDSTPEMNNILNTQEIDKILFDGNKAYVDFLQGQRPYYIEPEQLPQILNICNFSIVVTRPEWVINGLYPVERDQHNNSVNNLSRNLCEIFRADEYRTPENGFLFTGLNYTVSFWRGNNVQSPNSENSDPCNATVPDSPENSVFYLFNSHAINESNTYSNLIGGNGAKLFKIKGTYNLASLLLKNSPCDGDMNDPPQYSIHNIKMTSFTRVNNETTSSNNIVEHEENASKTLSAGHSQMIASTGATKKAGRPKKVTKGRNIQNKNAQLVNIESVDAMISVDHSQINTPTTSTNKSGRSKKVTREQNENAQLQNNKKVDAILSVDQSQKNAPTASTNKSGRPKTVIRGQNKQKENAHLEATIKYNKKHPEVNRDAVARYTTTHPEVNRDAVARYTTTHPEVNRDAVARYTATHPQVNRDAVNLFSSTHPEVNRESAARYRVNNPEQRSVSNTSYNNLNRHVIPILRAGTTLISERSGDNLDVVPLYSLKKSSLLADNVYRCPHCDTKLFEEEKNRKEWCCGHGRFNVLNLPAIEEQFYLERYFVKQARSYNNLFAFSALGVSHGFQQQATGLSFVKIQGRVYHRVFDLSHRNDLGPNPIGLYIDDGEERQRLAENRGLNQNILREITEYLHQVNPFILCFKRLSEETSDEAHLIFEHTTRRTHGNILGDMPRGNEIAAIMSTEREPYQPRSICIWKIGESRAHTVDIFNPLYEAFQYPMLYPHGGSGWTINTPDNRGNKLSQVKYYRCLLLSEVRFWQLGRLSEEWLVDMYCRVEEERLRFIARMQNRNSNSELRSAPLEEVINSEIARQITNDETVQGEGGVVPGKIYLPNTFTGGPRYMKCKYMDAIAIVNRLGRPSYFLTVTCNPKWPEIQQNTPQYCTPPAALCARVFNLKLNELLKDIRSGAWFGKLVYLFYVIEFQKRGLPHAHICFRVEGGGPVQNIDIDKVVRADIPSEQEAEGKLRTIVLKHMIHGPCGLNHRTDLPCWDAEKMKCNKRFPKPATDTTHTDDRGFVNLKRNETNNATITYRSQNISVNDRWVVPYNAALLLKYDCHMNLEIASTRKVIKYLFKYMTKGPDEARVAIVPDEHRDDEIEQYVTKRYIGACDAAWRMFEFDVTARQPNVKQLTVHLEGQQSVFFRQGAESEAVERSSSDLLKYFNRPTGPEFDELTYQDFYENYFVESSRPKTKNVTIHPICNGKYFVKKRQRGEMVARLFWVTPNRGEQFYLRMLLGIRPCRGYTDLLLLGGPNCTTFQEAARAIGIANDEEEYGRCLQEAAAFYTGKRLRHFFVLLITNGAPALILWNQFKEVLSEDIAERLLSQDPERAYERSLIEIDRLLRKHGSRLQDHGLPVVEDTTSELSRERLEYNSSRLNQFVDQWLPLLSREQKQVFDHVCTLLNSDNSSNVTSHRALFLDGPSGTGKTLLLNLIVAYVRGHLKGVAICTASSGIAAQNYDGGCTAHSMFRFPLDLVDDIGYWSLTNLSQRAELIRESSIIIYDEAPMAHKYLIHILDRSLQDLMGSSLLFGGKIIIFAGDFRQIPPVVTTARCPNDIVQASLRSSPLWQSLKKFSLTEAQRTREDEGYSDFLLNLGSGACETFTLGTGRDTVTLLNLLNMSFVTELTDLFSFVFPEDTLQDPNICASRAILTTHNANVREINTRILECVSGDIIHCYSVDCVDPEHADDFHLSLDTLHKVQAKGVPDYDLQIKKGCVCMVIRNLSFVDRLVNGTKVIVVDVSPRLVTVRKPYETETYLIPRISFKAPIEPGSPIEMCRRQFPLQVCYAMTVHKSQGQTIDRVGVDLRSDVFSHGQLYVALGRVRDKQNIKLLIRKERVVNGQPHANNVVIRSLIT